MDILTLTPLPGPPASEAPVEVVERKGVGHPDTLCDALAEELTRALVRHYTDRFGLVLHHNVDKVLLCAGASEPAFGGGRVVEPLTVFLSGRATLDVEGDVVPMEELARESARRWLGEHLHALDPPDHVEIRTMVRGGSQDLVELFRRQAREGEWLANDTSIGVGFAPHTPLERAVLAVERVLTSSDTTRAHPALGEDVKVMGVRRDDRVSLTVAVAMVDRHLPDLAAYVQATETARTIAREAAEEVVQGPVDVRVNAADDLEAGSVYLTVTGTSAEAGDDGQAGRGNRVGGLITPYRPMVMEAAAGKNPMSHTGKLYGVLSHRIAHALVERIPDITEAHCLLLSRIGRPVRRPALVDLRLGTPGLTNLEVLRPAIDGIVEEELDRAPLLWKDLQAGEVSLF